MFRAPAYVPLVTDPADRRYAHAGILPEERGGKGDLMTFAEIGAEALEEQEGRIVGRDLLGILKADVDSLGRVFAEGLGSDRSPARLAQLSRLLDGYFSERLPWLLEREFPATYTVYAGGDDLLLVCPWRFALPLALRLREDFSAFAGGNPNLTLSAGIAFVHPKHPLALAVEEAEEALKSAKTKAATTAGRQVEEAEKAPKPAKTKTATTGGRQVEEAEERPKPAKAVGRNQIGVFGRVLSWAGLGATLDLAEALNAAVRAKTLPPTFLHRMRWFAARRRAAEAGEARAADWNAKWRYHEARFLDRVPEAAREDLRALLLRALPPPALRLGGSSARMAQETREAEPSEDAEIAMTIALWRNR